MELSNLNKTDLFLKSYDDNYNTFKKLQLINQLWEKDSAYFT